MTGYVLDSILTDDELGFVLDSIEPAALPEIVIHDDFERASVNAALSEITTDTDDVLLLRLRARMQTITTQGNQPRWLEPVCKLTGVMGLRPRIEIVPYANGGFNNGANHQSWNNNNQRGHFSYDGIEWMPFDTLVRVDRLLWRHNTAFEHDEVWIAKSWPFSLTQCGAWIESLAAIYPTRIHPTSSAIAFTPEFTTGFPAQSFIAGEVSEKTDELGRSVPPTPFYAFEIRDEDYTPTKCAVITVGVHSGEDVGEVVFREFVSWLLGSSSEAVAMRQRFKVRIYPNTNPAGRYAGYWRGAPGSNVDTNRDWDSVPPAHESTSIAKSVITSDLNGDPLWWSFDVHSSPDGARMQVGARNLIPSTVAAYDAATARFPSGSWGVYDDINSNPPLNADRLSGYLRYVHGSSMHLLLETCDRPGPINPSNMQPYASALGGAIFDLDEDGWFSSPEIDLAAVGGAVAGGVAALRGEVPLSAVGVAVAEGGAGLAANVSISAMGLAQAAGAAGLSAEVLLSAAGAATAAGLAEVAAVLEVAAAGASRAEGVAALTGGGAGELAAVGAARAGGVAGLRLVVDMQAYGAAVAVGAAALEGLAAPGDLAASGFARAGGGGALRATVGLSAAGLVQAIGAGWLTMQVPLAAAGAARAGGAAGLVPGDVFVLVRDGRYVAVDGRRFAVRAQAPRRVWA